MPLDLDDDSVLSWKSHLLHFFAAYALWQISYCFLTGVVFRNGLMKDPEKITSVRYLIRDTKNPLVKMVIKLLTAHGMVKPGDKLDPDSALAQCVFIATQLVYTMLTSFHVRFLYRHYL